MNFDDINGKIDTAFSSYPKQLRLAAKFVRENPETVALNSLRQVSEKAGIHPSSLMRLVRELGFERYNEFRQPFKQWLTSQGPKISNRVEGLRLKGKLGRINETITDILAADQRDLAATINEIKVEDLVRAARMIIDARKVFILGLRSLHSAAFFLDYNIKMFSPKSELMDGRGGTLGDEIRYAGPEDVIIVLSHRYYSIESVRIANFAKKAGARLISIVDSPLAPTVAISDVKLLVNATPNSLLSSMVATMAVVQALVGAVVSEMGEEIQEKIKQNDAYYRDFEKFVDD